MTIDSSPPARHRHQPGAPTRVAVLMVVTLVLAGALAWVVAEFGAEGVAFAFAVNWLAMCWLGTLRLIVTPTLPSGFFEIKPYEQSGRLYELLGVRLVKRAVRRGPLHWFNPNLRMPTKRTVTQLQQLERRMREPEAAHAWLFGAMVLIAGHALVRGWWWSAGWTMAFNVAFNAYPVMLQRYNRRWLHEQIHALGG